MDALEGMPFRRGNWTQMDFEVACADGSGSVVRLADILCHAVLMTSFRCHSCQVNKSARLEVATHKERSESLQPLAEREASKNVQMIPMTFPM